MFYYIAKHPAGHLTVLISVLLAVGLRALGGALTNESSALHRYTGLIGTTVSGLFLYLIAIINIVILAGILRVFAGMRRGEFDEVALEEHLNNRGLLNRFLGRFARSVTQSWHMYPVGMLFGLGFDTATEIALLVLAGTSAAGGLPWYAIVCLPVLFAAGMSLLDTLDGSFMNFAYGWALSQPVRKVYYNIVITGLSVAVALIIGSFELLGQLASQLGWTGGFWDWVGGIDLNTIGFVIVGLFALTWVAALLIWKYARIEHKWNARLAPRGTAD